MCLHIPISLGPLFILIILILWSDHPIFWWKLCLENREGRNCYISYSWMYSSYKSTKDLHILACEQLSFKQGRRHCHCHRQVRSLYPCGALPMQPLRSILQNQGKTEVLPVLPTTAPLNYFEMHGTIFPGNLMHFFKNAIIKPYSIWKWQISGAKDYRLRPKTFLK